MASSRDERTSPEAFVARLGIERASAIVRWHDADVAARAMEAAVRGGFSIVEFTMTVPDVLNLLRDFSSRDGLVVGAGTVLSVEDVEAAVEAGANFLVSPVVDEAVVEAALECGVAVMPGAHTPTEMLVAHELGAPLVKLFPAPAGGPMWLQSLLGPLPFLRVVPTNGVDEGNVVEWLGAGAYAVGFAASLFDPMDLAGGRFGDIEARARRIIEQVQAAPSG